MIKHYLFLQFKMSNRRLSDFGVHPVLGYILIAILFTIFSVYLFYNIENAEYLYGIIASTILLFIAGQGRIDFLKTALKTFDFFKLRAIENLLCILPFFPLLIYNQFYWIILGLLAFAFSMVFLNFNNRFSVTIPTPFSKNPFEFSFGFRKYILLFVLVWIVFIIALIVGNFNLGFFTFIDSSLITFSFYFFPENKYFVWVYNKSPKGFLFHKLKIGLINFLILNVPLLIALCIIFPSKILLLVISLFVLIIYLGMIILAKYAAYPNVINLPESIIIVLTIFLPPLVIGVIPFFYQRSIRKLSDILT